MTDDDGTFVREALTAAAAAGVPDSDRAPAWQPPAPTPQAGRWVGQRRIVAVLAAAAVVVVVGAVSAVVALTRPDQSRPLAPAPISTSVPQPSPSVDSPSPGAQASSPPASPPGSSSAPTSPPAAFELGYQPLWPFADRSAASAWEQQFASSGSQPWHLDAGATALSFTTGYLGFTEIDRVVSITVDDLGSHVSVGYLDPNGAPHVAAVLHLVRFGPSASAPWEVVGSDDGDFSIEQPAYGSLVRSPLTVGGHITGVDENIRLSVRGLSSAMPVGQACCLPAGGVHSPWSIRVSYPSPTDAVLTLVASTGGHLQQVERFAIHGVRTR